MYSIPPGYTLTDTLCPYTMLFRSERSSDEKLTKLGVVLARRGGTEEELEGGRRLPDEHGEATDGVEPDLSRMAQQPGFQRRIDRVEDRRIGVDIGKDRKSTRMNSSN